MININFILGKWIYSAGDDGYLHIFDVLTGHLEDSLQVVESSEVISISHHPYRNLLCTTTADGQLKLWKP